MRTRLAVLFGLFVCPSVMGQPKPFELPPQMPTLTTPVNLGLTVGASETVTLTGTHLADATGILTTIPGATAELDAKDPKPDKRTAKVTVPAGTPVGLYQIRVVTAVGVTNFRPVCVDELPEVLGGKPEGTKEKPTPVVLPAVVRGRVDAESSHFYLARVAAGEQLTIEVLARRIGSPLDPVIVLHDAKTRKELTTLYADDTPGLQGDARLTHTFPAATEVMIEVRDGTYRGGPEFGYRLRLGDFPSATTAYPLAVETDAKTEVGFTGANLDGVPAVKPTVVGVSPRRGGRTGWPVAVAVSGLPERVEHEPNDEPAKAESLAVPGGVTARFATKNDRDHFRFTGKKGQKLEIATQTHEFNSATEVYFKVLDAKGTELAKSDPSKPTARIEFDPPADGDYTVAAEHLNYQYGPSEVYHLSVRRLAPDFEVALGFDRLDVPVGGIGLLPVVGLTPINGFNASIDLTVDSPVFTGSLTIPAGAKPQPATPLYLPVRIKPDAKPTVSGFQVTGVATVNGSLIRRPASVAGVVRAGLSGLPNIPKEMTTTVIGVAVGKPAFVVSATFDASQVVKGGKVTGKLTAVRNGYEDDIAVDLFGLPANVKTTVKVIPKGKSTVEFELSAAINAVAGGVGGFVRGTAKVAGRDFAYVGPVGELKVIDAGKK